MLNRWFCFVFALLSFLISQPGSAQGKEGKTERLIKIREKTRAINTETNYKVVRLEDAELILGHATDGGASLTGYYKDGALQKIIEWVGLSNRVIQNEYYFDSGKLIFVYATESQYAFNDSLQSLDYTKLIPVSNGRYYFENNQLSDVILAKKSLEKSKKEDAKSFLHRVKAYKTLLDKKRN